MNRTLIGVAAVAMLTTACASNARHIGLKNAASLNAEDHGMWTRPTEIGFKMGGEISGSAEAQRVFGLHVGESKPSGGAVAALLAPITGAASLSPVEGFAAYKAVTEARAEGIYVTRIETERRGFLFFWSKTNVTLYGRALTLEDYGPVYEERADRWRYRNYGPNAVVIKEGKADVSVPFKVK